MRFVQNVDASVVKSRKKPAQTKQQKRDSERLEDASMENLCKLAEECVCPEASVTACAVRPRLF